MTEPALELGESITIASCEPEAPVDSGVRSKGEVDAEESEVGISGIKKGIWMEMDVKTSNSSWERQFYLQKKYNNIIKRMWYV